MTELTLTKTRLASGIWEGELSGPAGNSPSISATHEGQPLADLALTPQGEGTWLVRLPIPATAISDGVQAFVMTDDSDGSVINAFTLMAGDPADGDLRSEVELLRAELDLLKRAFRRHCVETA